MCLVCIAINMRVDLPIIIMGNRDEYYDRPTVQSHFWEPDLLVLAGKDLLQGGTWLGITRDGRFCTVLNFREPDNVIQGAPSRGQLVLEFLKGSKKPSMFIQELEKYASNYNGFNLILGDKEELWWFSNRGGIQRLNSGIYAISNHLLDTPWPKVRKSKRAMAGILDRDIPSIKRTLLEVLQDDMIAPDHELPSTGVSLEWERILSSVFVKSPSYGTRSSHLILVHSYGKVEFIERVYKKGTKVQDREFLFYLV